MPTDTYLTVPDGGGNYIPLAGGGNEFSDGDGVTRYHALNTLPKRQQSGPATQSGLAANTLSNPITPVSATLSTLFIKSSAAGTVTIWLQSTGGGAYYQYYSDQGTAISITFAANQTIAIPIPPCNGAAIECSVLTNITLEVCGRVGG